MRPGKCTGPTLLTGKVHCWLFLGKRARDKRTPMNRSLLCAHDRKESVPGPFRRHHSHLTRSWRGRFCGRISRPLGPFRPKLQRPCDMPAPRPVGGGRAAWCLPHPTFLRLLPLGMGAMPHLPQSCQLTASGLASVVGSTLAQVAWFRCAHGPSASPRRVIHLPVFFSHVTVPGEDCSLPAQRTELKPFLWVTWEEGWKSISHLTKVINRSD